MKKYSTFANAFEKVQDKAVELYLSKGLPFIEIKKRDPLLMYPEVGFLI